MHQFSVHVCLYPMKKSYFLDYPSANDVDMISSVPFVMADEIFDASPAAEDGLQLGDQNLGLMDIIVHYKSF